MDKKTHPEDSPSNYDSKGNAKHYTDQRINVIRMIEQIWGTEATMMFCEINDFKYRMRAGKKGNVEQDLVKANWYATMAKALMLRKNEGLWEKGLGSEKVNERPEFNQLMYGTDPA